MIKFKSNPIPVKQNLWNPNPSQSWKSVGFKSESVFISGLQWITNNGAHIPLFDNMWCLLDLYFCIVKQETDCFCHVGTGSGSVSDLKFSKHYWIRIQKNHNSDTSGRNQRSAGVDTGRILRFFRNCIWSRSQKFLNWILTRRQFLFPAV